MRIKRVLASFLTVICLFTCFTVPASAKNVSSPSIGDTASPMYQIADSLGSTLNFIGNTAEFVSSVYAGTAVKITIKQTLQKYSGWFWIWNDVDGESWTKITYSNTTYMRNTKSGLSSGKYRLKSEFTLVDGNGKTEELTVYSSTKSI